MNLNAINDGRLQASAESRLETAKIARSTTKRLRRPNLSAKLPECRGPGNRAGHRGRADHPLHPTGGVKLDGD